MPEELEILTAIQKSILIELILDNTYREFDGKYKLSSKHQMISIIMKRILVCTYLTDDITGQFPLISNSVLMYLQAQIKKL
jgi:hypothetical protein